MDDSVSFIAQVHARRQSLAAVLCDEEYSGIREIVEELYPDHAHFIYELLQNAEDRKAKHVSFELEADGLVFEHDGDTFEESHVWAITNMGKGSKSGSDDQIGRFGIGFKSVFAYTDTPQIWSPTYSFQIADLVLPTEIALTPGLGNKTRFRFPFNNPKKSPASAFSEIELGLREIAETTLLFLTSLHTIKWTINDHVGEVTRTDLKGSFVEILKQCDGETITTCHFLRMREPVTGLPKKNVAIAFELEQVEPATGRASRSIGSKYRLIEARPGKVFVSFPAEKETSGLRFHIHAPFVPELSRASVKDTPVNDPLFEQIGALMASALVAIRNLGLLTVDFLGVLPNPQDSIPERYECIRVETIRAMKTVALTPTNVRSHAPANQLRQARASCKAIFSEEDLEFLIDYEEEPPRWAAGAPQRNSNVDRFLVGLGIAEFDAPQVLRLLVDKVGLSYAGLVPDAPLRKGFITWLKAKSDEWFRLLYAFLWDHLSSLSSFERSKRVEELKQLPIVFQASGELGLGNSSYFPSAGMELDDLMPGVSPGICGAGESKSHLDARSLLEALGVREIGEAEQIEAILKSRYTHQHFDPKIDDLIRFCSFLEQEPGRSELFKSYLIFKRADEKWAKPMGVFLDSPFLATHLNALRDDSSSLSEASAEYLDLDLATQRFVLFAQRVGAIWHLAVRTSFCRSNPDWDILRGGDVRKSNNDSYGGIDTDFDIPEFESLTRQQSVNASMLIWITMIKTVEPRHLVARYKRNNHSSEVKSHSRLVHRLLRVPWVPQTDVGYVTPSEASRDLLPSGFAFDSGWDWLSAIGFGSAHSRPTVAELLVQQGYSNDEAKEIEEFGALTPEERRMVLDSVRAATRPEKPSFPTRSSNNPERRSRKLSEELADPSPKTYSPRLSSTRTSKPEMDAKEWLYEMYENDDAQVICQLCQEEMPFRRRDRRHYFEKVELLSRDYLPNEKLEQWVALCPECGAKYKEYVKSDDDIMAGIKRAILEWPSDECCSEDWVIEIDLGAESPIGPSLELRFVEDHARALRTILAE